MAYANAGTPRSRLPVLVAVAAIHVAAGYALVTGLAANFIKVAGETFVASNIPLDPPKPSPPPEVLPSDTPQIAPLTVPQPALILPTDNTIRVDPMLLPPLTSSIAEVKFPVPEITPSVAPGFTPKGAVPRGNAGLWVTPDDYPADDLRRGNQGITRFRLTVDADGRVRDCAVTGTSGFASLDRAACGKLASRARFTPATDESGAKVAGTYASAVRWEIPD
jgi:periplasmic protein TonB